MNDSLQCNRCGARLALAVAVCPGCGQERNLESRLGTFLFCDLVRSTRLLSGRSPGEQVKVMNAFHAAVRAVMTRHGIEPDRVEADGYFISWQRSTSLRERGTPVTDSQEDNASAAIGAGLDLAKAVKAAGDALGEWMRVRVGITSGYITTGHPELNAFMRDAGYVGLDINLAKRLASAARPGRVLVDAATHRLAGAFFRYGQLRNQAFVDFQPTPTWRVAGRTQVDSRFEALHAAQADRTLQGREPEMAALRDAWARTTAGDTVAVQLRSDAGLGKSSLAHELCQHAVQAGARVFKLDCMPRTSHTPFFPVAAALKRLAGLADDTPAHEALARIERRIAHDDGPAQARELAPFLPLLAMQEAAGGAGSDRTVTRAAEAAANWIRHGARHQPVLVLAEDMHWADEGTAALVQALAQPPAGAPAPALMVLATTRDHAPANRVAPFIAIDLKPVDTPAATAIVRRILGEQPAGGTVARIVRLADGNPLFLEELARAADDPARLRSVENAGKQLPHRLALLVQTRIDRLPLLSPIVQAAALLGPEFSLELLGEFVDDRAGLPLAAAQLVEERLWEPVEAAIGRQRFRFRHELIQKAVYESWMDEAREAKHELVAARLLKSTEAVTSTPELVAYHLVGAKRHDEAARHYLAAAQAAARRGAYIDSVEHCDAGIAQAQAFIGIRTLAASAATRAVLGQLHIAKGVAAAATSGYAADVVEKAYQLARDASDDPNDPAALFPIVRGLGTFNFVRARFERADALGNECEALARSSGRPDQAIEAASFLGYTTLYRGQPSASRRALESCLALYRAERGERFSYPSPQDAGIAALSLLGITAWLQGDCQAAEAAAGEALDHAERLARPIDQAYVHVWLSMLRNLQRRFEEAREQADLCIGVSEEHGFSTWLVAAKMQRCIALTGSASTGQELDALQQTLALFRYVGAEANVPYFEWGIARACLALDDRPAARAALARAHAQAQASGETYLVPEILVLEGELADDPVASRRAFTAAFELAVSQESWMLALRALVGAWSRTGADAIADPLLDRAAALLADGGASHPPPDGWVRDAVQQLRATML